MIYGYCRVSTFEQNLDLQVNSLKSLGSDVVIFTEKASSIANRPILDSLLLQLTKGDILAVWRLDRLGRSLKFLLDTFEYLNSIEANIISMTENIDTTSITGRLIFNIFSSIAEFERELIIERTRAGLSSAKQKGVKLGRRTIANDVSTIERAKLAYSLYTNRNGNSVNSIANSLKMSRATFYRYINLYKSFLLNQNLNE